MGRWPWVVPALVGAERVVPREPGWPRFTVLIAAYQAAATIGAAVDSALTQTWPAHEVIVVDDGSTDGTSEVLASYGERIVVLCQPNRGVSAARNLGLRQATGEYVSLLDADDVYAPERLAALAELARARPDLDVLMTDLEFELEGEPVGRFAERTPFAAERQDVEILRRCFVAEPALRRCLLLDAGGFDEGLAVAEDWDCWIRLLVGGARAGLVDAPLTRYRLSAGSLTARRVASLWARVAVLDRAAVLRLSAEQRAVLAVARREARRRALLADADQALVNAEPGVRAKALALAQAPEAGRRARLRGLAGALAPGPVGRLMRSRRHEQGDPRVSSLASGAGSRPGG